MNYPFNIGDLICCGQCTSNYLDNNPKVPWEDLRYIFGEIMYGGHIVEDWDRRLATAYLSRYFNEGLLDTAEHFPTFSSPPPSLSNAQARIRRTIRIYAIILNAIKRGCSICITINHINLSVVEKMSHDIGSNPNGSARFSRIVCAYINHLTK